MRYMGSKRRIVKQLMELFNPYLKPGVTYVEPFMGGCNSLCQIDAARKIGNDVNPWLVSMFRALQLGWVPPETISKEEYYDIKNNKIKYPPELVGFVSFCCSFGGKEWGGYASSPGRSYCREGRDSLLKQVKGFIGVEFKNQDYLDLEIPENSVVYCDPPYRATTSYKTVTFDYDKFYAWMISLKDKNCKVFISEYDAPEEFFILIKEIKLVSTLNLNKKDPKIEKIFTLR